MSSTPISEYNLKLVQDTLPRNSAISPGDFKASNIEIEPYELKDKKTNKVIGTRLNLHYMEGGRKLNLYLETPAGSYTRFGMTDGFKNNGDYSILIQKKSGYLDECSDPDMRTELLKDLDNFYTELQKLDQMVKDYCIENYELLFNKKYSLEMRKEMMESNFFTIVKDKSTDSMTLPLQINLKCPKFKDTTIPDLTFSDINVRDKDDEINPMPNISFEQMSDVIQPHSSVTCNFQIQFWMVNGNCGLKCNTREILYIKTSDVSKSRKNTWGRTTKYENHVMNNPASSSEKTEELEPRKLPSAEELEKQLKDAKKFSSDESDGEEGSTEEVSVVDSEDEAASASA